MEIELLDKIIKKIAKIKQKDSRLFTQIQKQLLQFKRDRHHPSLRTHKLIGNLKTE